MSNSNKHLSTVLRILSRFLTQLRTSVSTVVYKGILDLAEEGKQEVAVRQLKQGIPKANTIRFMQEIAILTQIHHPSIVQFYGMIENENPVSTLQDTHLLSLVNSPYLST